MLDDIFLNVFKTFRGIKEKIWKKINRWQSIFLSTSGSEVLIRVVLQAMPIYIMNMFLLPKNLCKEINVALANF